MTGYEAAEEFRRRFAASDAGTEPLIYFATAHVLSPADCTAHHGDGCVSKPFSRSQLMRVLEAAQRQQLRQSSPAARPRLLPAPETQAAQQPEPRVKEESVAELMQSPQQQQQQQQQQSGKRSLLASLWSPRRLLTLALWRYRALCWSHCAAAISEHIYPCAAIGAANEPLTSLLLLSLPYIYRVNRKAGWLLTAITVFVLRHSSAVVGAGSLSLGSSSLFILLLLHLLGVSVGQGYISGLLCALQSVAFYMLEGRGYHFGVERTRENTLMIQNFTIPLVMIWACLWVAFGEWVRARSFTLLTAAVVDLRRTQRKTDKKRRMQDNLTAAVTRDVRMPLSVVLGITERLIADPQLPATAQHATSAMETAANMLPQLLGNMADAVRVSGAVDIELRPLPTDLRLLVCVLLPG